MAYGPKLNLNNMNIVFHVIKVIDSDNILSVGIVLAKIFGCIGIVYIYNVM